MDEKTRQNATGSCQKRVYLKTKVIILKKIQVTMKTFIPPFFNRFSLRMNRKQRVRAVRKKIKSVYASAANLLHIGIENLNCCKGGHCKNEAREIDCLCGREIEVDAMLVIWLKSHSVRGASPYHL